MANAPVQVVLDVNSFRVARETQPPKSAGKDFFLNDDNGFAAHKQKIERHLTAVAGELQRPAYEGFGYAKVQLRQQAWAKSHRPVQVLFRQNRTPLVGSAGLGELIVEVTQDAVAKVAAEIQGAEVATRFKVDRETGEAIPNPSRRRVEAGTIDSISLWSATDRRSFSAKDAVLWLSDPRTGHAYYVELFQPVPPPSEWNTLPAHMVRALQTLTERLSALGAGLVAEQAGTDLHNKRTVSIRLTTGNADPQITLHGRATSRSSLSQIFDPDISRHERLLAVLDEHPLVRRIMLPPIPVKSAEQGVATSRAAPVPETDQRASYPTIGVIDSGIADCLGGWITGRWGFLANVDRDEAHGTFIGGLLVAGQSLNSIELAPERDGCNLVDVDILPRDSALATYYPGGVIEFFDELENAVRTCRARYGTRIFNLSINLETPANVDSYSPFASHLDAIADETGAIIVVSAGNLVDPNQRAEWPADPTSALAILAAHRDDQVFMPSESLRNVSVSALNPPGLSGSIAHAPARYSRRGPGLRSGFKPDLCHVGGSGTHSGALETGLFSVSPTGALVSGCGTSYSAPLVARTLASLDSSIEGQVERETLIALAVHGAKTPEPLRHTVLQQVARHLAGFGRPAASGDLLERGDNEITLVFHARLVPDKKLCFDFTWPPSLVRSGGKCSGEAQVTLVARPPLKAAFGSEAARVNVEASLQQDNGAGKFTNRLKPSYLEFADDKGSHEIELIEHGFKWSPVKQYRRRMKGLGKSSNWRLCIDYLTRAGEALPAEGVPFTAVLRIAGSESNRNVFPEMQQILSRLGTRIADIRTAARITPRV